MEWEAIGAIGELAGAAAVVATLIYLSAQIRQNNRNLQEANSSTINEGIMSINTRLSADGEFTDIVLRGRSDPDSLSEVEFERFRAWAMDLLNLAVYVDGIKSTHKGKPLHYDMTEVVGGFYQEYPGFQVAYDSVEDLTPNDLIARFNQMKAVRLLDSKPETPYVS